MPSPGRLVMLLLVRDEADILRENILFHLNRGVDHVVVTDNLSTDGTTAIVEEFQKQGVASLLREGADDYDQGVWMTRMAYFATERCGADWVLLNDADEFWFPGTGNLKDELVSDADVVLARRQNMVPGPVGVGPHPLLNNFLAIKRTRGSDSLAPSLAAPIGPKAIYRAHGISHIEQGNHAVRYHKASGRGRSQANSDLSLSPALS